MTRVVLINPPVEKIKEEHDAPAHGHIGLAYLAATLRQSSIKTTIIDAKLSRLSMEEVLDSVSKLSPELIGITSFSHEINISAKLASKIKERMSGSTIVAGGPHASSLPEETLKNFGAFDYLVKGEGEHSIVALAKAVLNSEKKAIPGIPGVGYRQGGQITVTPKADWIKDLDALPFPAWDLFPEMTVFPVISSRGCPFKCVFCMKMLGDRIRLRSPENVIAELQMLHKSFGAKDVVFYDETFGFKKTWLGQFLDGLMSSRLNQELKWGMITRAHVLTRELLQRFKRAGCVKIDFGVESGNDRILEIIRKGETKEDFIRAARLIKQAGIKSHSYYILGHPYETKATAKETIDFAAKLNTDYISIGIMIPYPGTEVARLASLGQAGYRKISSDWADYNKQLGKAIELDSLSAAELTRLQMVGYLKFYLTNFKVLPFVKNLWKYRKLVLAILKKYVSQVKTNQVATQGTS
ncbi:MAG TPA: hypothetical protein DCP92_05675 [Nitrospiraceae bacterium]|nr:hypothetical protein [Nitrospiraceae bacterium]